MFDETDKEVNAIAGISDVRRALKIHDLRTLLFFSGLKVAFDEQMLVDIKFSDLYTGLICKWNEQSRYQTIGTNLEHNVKRLIDLLGNKTQGVLQWIQQSAHENVLKKN
jgi:hypothetical protein